MKKYFLLVVLVVVVGNVVGQDANLHPFMNDMRYELKDEWKVKVPVLPKNMTFAGEKVPLDNFDTRESLYREIFSTQYMHSRSMITLLSMKRFLPMIEKILKKNGIPSDFKYLCMAESGLNPNISSGVGAAGLWQLMPAVGRQAGMEVGSDVDERFDVEKATEAACAHLKESYDIFGSWALAAAAYNLGNAGLKTRIERQSVNNYYDAFLPQETLRYVFRCIAWKLIAENPSKYGFDIARHNYYPELTDYTEIEVNDKRIDWSAVAIKNGTTYKMLRELNFWIRDYYHNNPTGKTYLLKIPSAKFRTN